MNSPSSKKLIVGAIDFGTTYSGYAYSTIDDFQRNPLSVHCKTWPSSSMVSHKTPTCALFKPDKSFHSFGYDAEDNYASLAEDGNHGKWYFFRRFKMVLFDTKSISKSIFIEDVSGKKMVALDVFAACIRYLKNDLCVQVEQALPKVEDTDVEFVLTVPAIWNEPAKSFMREAAIKAGIPDGQLKLVLEPEAASVYCRHLPDMELQKKYLMLDAGGGTSDIAVHEVTDGGNLREIYRANGGDWGGTKVDDAFSDLLKDIFGESWYKKFVAEKQEDWLEIFRSFELAKRRVSSFQGDKKDIKLRIPYSFTERACKSFKKKNIQDVVSLQKEYKSAISWKTDKLMMNENIVSKLFKTSVNQIVSHLIALFEKPCLKDVKCILMVGGFSESLMLQEAVKAEFERRDIQILVPPEAGLAVLKGAVIFGHEPSVIKSRISRFTYGFAFNCPFEEGTHAQEKKIKSRDGTYYCTDLFLKIVEEGTEISTDDTFSETMVPLNAEQTSMTTQVVASKEKDITYITDPGAINLGKLFITLPETSEGLDREVYYEIKFGDTELQVSAKDLDSDRKVEAKFDFL